MHEVQGAGKRQTIVLQSAELVSTGLSLIDIQPITRTNSKSSHSIERVWVDLRGNKCKDKIGYPETFV